MGFKKVLISIGKVISYPLRKLFKEIFSARGYTYLQKAAQVALDTPLGELVLAVVQEVELIKAGELDQAKHQAAITKIIEEATRKGINYTGWAVNILLELAVGVVKKKLGTLEAEQ